MLITFEGTDGCGKSTQIAALQKRLLTAGYDVVLTREPGGTTIAEAIRSLVLDVEHSSMTASCEALLYAAARAQHVAECIKPALASDKVVICDRFFDSSIAYQAFGRELGVDFITQINHVAMDGLLPDRTYLLQMPANQAKDRRKGSQEDRIEGAGQSFFEKVELGYQWVWEQGQGRVLALDATRGIQEISQTIWEDIMIMLSHKI